MTAWKLAASLNFAAALLHLAVIAGGPEWYRFFGAGEKLAQMAEQKRLWPAVLTLLITAILASWGLYCLSMDGTLWPLPWMEVITTAITAVYLLRALYPLLLSPFVVFFRTKFMIWSSLICGLFGLVHLIALWPVVL